MFENGCSICVSVVLVVHVFALLEVVLLVEEVIVGTEGPV